jgi:hypothetical protein
MDSNGGDEHAWLSEDGGEGCAMNENRASLDSNGGDEHATECRMGLSALEALRNSPYDGDVRAIDIDEHVQDLGILEKDIQYPNLPNGSLELLRIQSPTVRGHSSFQFRAPPGLQPSLHEIYTKLRTFVKQEWAVTLYRSEPPTALNTVHQTVEGCSETNPLYLRIHKSGDIESISLSGEMFSALEVLYGCGWIEV